MKAAKILAVLLLIAGTTTLSHGQTTARPNVPRPAALPTTMPATATAQPFSGDARGAVPSATPGASLVTSMTAAPVKLGPGDLLEIGVFDTPELTGRVRVNSDGNISLPLIGSLHVAGSSPEQAADTISRALVRGDFVKDPQVSLFVLEYATQMVYVIGEVWRPGPYPVMGSHRLLDFLSVAGGLTPKAGGTITIARREEPAQALRVALGRNGAPESNPEIGPGDSITVAQAGIVYVVGDVGKPGGFLLERGQELTVMKALALAEGMKPTAGASSARLVRTTEQGRQEIPLDIKKILAAKTPDLKLQADDIVYVPGSAARSGFRRGVDAAVQAAVGVAIYHR